MKEQPDNSIDLIFCSPPYEDARGYAGLKKFVGQTWVDWAAERFKECVRVSRGLTAWVIEGRTKDFRYSSTPQLLHADLHRAGIKMRKPPIFSRHGIMGSGGPEWWRNDYEIILCASKGRLPWSDNTATGHPPKYRPGGAPSHRKSNDQRVEKKAYKPPKLANPGNIIHCSVGKGHMGHELAHENEAPFPVCLAKPFVLSYCPPGGTVCDPFSGSGTTVHTAALNGRNGIGIDMRLSQTALARKRLESVGMVLQES